MPYICLAQSLPDGMVQILDLVPNSSRQRPGHDSPGQTRYLNRVQNDTAAVQINNGLLINEYSSGLRAYLLDKVEPGGLQRPTATLTLTGVLAADTVTIGGVVFTAQAGGANPALQQFNMNAGDNATATSLALTINDAASTALIVAANAGAYVVASALLNECTLDGVPILGPDGSLTLASTSAVREAISTPVDGVTNRLAREREHWNSCLTATAAALISRMDAGLSMTLAAVDVILFAEAGAELTSLLTSNSVGVLTELLAVLSGRGYRVNRLSRAGVTQQFFTATNPSYEWNSTVLGGFTYSVTVNSGWQNGEIVPTSIGGNTENREWKGIRYTYDGGSFTISVMTGALATMRQLAGQPAITLYPDSDLEPHYPWTYQGTLNYPQVDNVRMVTVYNDDGSLAG